MLKIKKIDPLLISSNYGDNKVLGQPLGLKTIGIVKIETECGLVGYGESYVAIYLPELFAYTIKLISQKLINASFDDPREIYESSFIPFASRNGFYSSAYSAIDIALWDLVCKFEDKTLKEYLSFTKKSKQNFYFSGGSAALSANEIKEEATKIDSNIFKGYKIRVGKQTWQRDIARIKSARNNWKGEIMIDAIMGTIRPPMDIDDWKLKLENLDNLNLLWLEEPLEPDDINNLKKIKEIRPNLNIATGEALTGKLELRTYLTNPYLDFIQIDVTHIGGISMLLSLIEEIKNSNKNIAMHVWGSPLAFSANFQFGTLFNKLSWIEYPGVMINCFKKFEPNYYSKSPNLKFYKETKGFTSIKFEDVEAENKFVPGTGYEMPSKKIN